MAYVRGVLGADDGQHSRSRYLRSPARSADLNRGIELAAGAPALRGMSHGSRLGISAIALRPRPRNVRVERLLDFGAMTPLMAPSPLAGSDTYERILTAPGGLVVLEHVDSSALIEQFRALARHHGQSVYVWRAETGMENLREAHTSIPGSQRLGNALRYIQQSIHFGIYLLTPFALPLTPTDSTLLRQLARAPAGHVRRVVLLDAPSSLVSSIDDVAVHLGGSMDVVQRPRLRDGRWLL